MTQGIDQDKQWSLQDWKEVSDDFKLRVTADVITNTQKVKHQDRLSKEKIEKKNKRRRNKVEKDNVNNERERHK